MTRKDEELSNKWSYAIISTGFVVGIAVATAYMLYWSR